MSVRANERERPTPRHTHNALIVRSTKKTVTASLGDETGEKELGYIELDEGKTPKDR